MAPMNHETRKMVADAALFLFGQVAVFYAFRAVMKSLDPQSTKKKEAKTKSEKTLKKLGLDLPSLDLNEHEQIIAGEVISSDDIDVRFKDIGGLDPIIGQLREAVIFPLCYPDLINSSSGLFGAPKGVLLYGPPGCGKTMLAKALAKESGATFINLSISTISDKWFGESNKLVAALFSLAKKLQPSIIFIDEIDSFLRERRSSDHEVTGMMKAEFMSLLDGLTSSDSRILLLGATNRPNDIDAAILRRMPKRFAVRLPDAQQRRNILQLMLKDVKLAAPPAFSMDALVRRTEGQSGSDLKETCRNAVMVPMREIMRSHSGEDGQLDLEQVRKAKFDIRPLTLQDFVAGETVAQRVDADPLD